MTSPFEVLLGELGQEMEINIKADLNDSCRLMFAGDVFVQIDLATNADAVLIGSELGRLVPGPYREKILKQALRVNGLSTQPRGILSYSEKIDALILYQYLPLSQINGKGLNNFLQIFVEHARIWHDALAHNEIPQLEEDLKK